MVTPQFLSIQESRVWLRSKGADDEDILTVARIANNR
jgi:hypothetical protein